MSFPLRFQVFIPNTLPWTNFVDAFVLAEELGFDLACTADHFVHFLVPEKPWTEMFSGLAGVAVRTSKIRIGPMVAQIPLRNPAMFARQALTLDHISNGRLELGMGIGLPEDRSYDCMGIANWSNKERVARFPEYLDIVHSLLANETTSYKGEFYEVNEAIMNPRPVQKPRPPITIAAMGPKMVKIAAQYGDTWNCMSFKPDLEGQMTEIENCMQSVNEICLEIGRDPKTLRRSYFMRDAKAHDSGWVIDYLESESKFIEAVNRVVSMGFSDICIYYPYVEKQRPMFEQIAKNVLPQLREEFKAI